MPRAAAISASADSAAASASTRRSDVASRSLPAMTLRSVSRAVTPCSAETPVRAMAPSTHGPLVLLSALAGGLLLMAADVAARVGIAPQELPVGVLTAVLGGMYLLWLMHQRSL